MNKLFINRSFLKSLSLIIIILISIILFFYITKLHEVIAIFLIMAYSPNFSKTEILDRETSYDGKLCAITTRWSKGPSTSCAYSVYIIPIGTKIDFDKDKQNEQYYVFGASRNNIKTIWKSNRVLEIQCDNEAGIYDFKDLWKRNNDYTVKIVKKLIPKDED